MSEHKFRTFFIAVGLFVLYELLTIPYFSIARLEKENPAVTALMKQRLEEAGEVEQPLKITQKWIPLYRLPKHVTDAIVVAEDGTFYSHGGIDWFEVRESLEKNVDKWRFARGASTITQQLAKNLFLSTSKDPVRKFKEVLITILLEHFLSKSRILELYVNVIEWGRGVFGIEAASQRYFGKSASNLSLDEATRLAAVIPSPLRHRPNDDSRYVLRRKQIVLRRMEARNFVGRTSKEGTPDPGIKDLLEPVDSADVPDTPDIDEERNGL